MDGELKKAIDRLAEYTGSTYMYRGRNVKIIGYSNNEGVIEIKTTTHPIRTTLMNLGATLDELLPVDDDEASADNKTGKDTALAMAVYTNQTSGLETLESTLLNNINKLQDNPDFLPQAKEINNQARSLIQIAKTKIDLFREIRKANVKQ